MQLSSIRRAAYKPVVFRYRGRELTVGDIEQIAACLAWTSAAFKVKDRDDFIG